MRIAEVVRIISPQTMDGTTLWAGEPVLELLSGRRGGFDRLQCDRAIRKLQHYCDANFRVYMPEAVKREYGGVFGIHVWQFRIAGFFDNGYADFIALNWFAKKTRRNDQRMNDVYRTVDAIRKAGAWRKAD